MTGEVRELLFPILIYVQITRAGAGREVKNLQVPIVMLIIVREMAKAINQVMCLFVLQVLYRL